MMSQTFTLNLYGFGLCAAAAALVLLCTAMPGKIKGLPEGTTSVFCAISIPMALLMARLLYVIINFRYYTETYENPALMLCFWDGGLSMTGAIGGVVLAGMITASVCKQSFAALADAFSGPLSISIALLFFGEQFTDLGGGKTVADGTLAKGLPFLFSQEKMGTVTVYNLLPWRYEAFAFLLLGCVTAVLFLKNHERDGNTALLFFSWAGAITILLESMRDDGHMLIIFFRIAQLGGLIMVLVPFVVLCVRLKKRYDSLKTILLASALQLVALAGMVLIEFALDGRLSFGVDSMAINYLAMFLCCCLMAVTNCVLLSKLEREKI